MWNHASELKNYCIMMKAKKNDFAMFCSCLLYLRSFQKVREFFKVDSSYEKPVN